MCGLELVVTAMAAFTRAGLAAAKEKAIARAGRALAKWCHAMKETAN